MVMVPHVAHSLNTWACKEQHFVLRGHVGSPFVKSMPRWRFGDRLIVAQLNCFNGNGTLASGFLQQASLQRPP
jgi:hypothetical protein